MRRSILIAKLHGLRVTGADLHYEGSIALDPEHCEQVGLLPYEFVEIWNKTTGSRISTYVIHGERGGRGCMLNGAAARSCQIGDELIIAARTEVELAVLGEIRPRIAIFATDVINPGATVEDIVVISGPDVVVAVTAVDCIIAVAGY